MLKCGSCVATFLDGPYGRHSQTMGTHGTGLCGMAAPTLVPMGKDPVGGPWHAPMHPGLLLLDPKERHGFTSHSEVEQQLGQ